MTAKNASHATSNNLTERECPTKGKHDAHEWHSHVINKQALCKGSGVPATYTGGTSWTPPKKKDYSEDWREDYSQPMGVKEARKIAFDMHANQKDKAGEPYAQHLEAVRLGVVVLGGGVEEQVAALFHDAVEDYHTTYEHLRKIGCTDETVKIVEAVSKRSGEEQGVYLDRIIKAGPGAMRVKLADLMHNTRHDRMEALKSVPGKGQATVDRLLKKYRPAMARLMLELGMIVDEDAQKKLATKPQGSTSYGSGYYGTNSDGTQSFSVASLIVGDWPKIFDAPILRKLESTDKTQAFLLANGEVRVEDKKYANTGTERKLAAHTQSSWEKSMTGDAFDYSELIDAEKEKSKTATGFKSTSTAGTTGAWSGDEGATVADLIGTDKDDEKDESVWSMNDDEFDQWAKDGYVEGWAGL